MRKRLFSWITLALVIAALGSAAPAAAALDANSVDLSKSIGAAYGAEAAKAFLPLWRSHIGFFVDYTKATAATDTAAGGVRLQAPPVHDRQGRHAVRVRRAAR